MLRLVAPILFFLLVLTAFFLRIVLPAHPSISVSFAGFAAFFLLSLLFGVLDLIAKVSADPESHLVPQTILKLLETSPFHVPALVFSASAVSAALLSSSRQGKMIPVLFLFFLFCSAIYIVEMILLRNALRRYYGSVEAQQREGMHNIETDSVLDGGRESKKALLLINPENQTLRGYSYLKNSKFQPLGLGILAALTPDDFHVKLIDENIDTFRYEDADLVGITASTSSATRAYEIASQYRRRGIPVVMGGIHASMLPDEALDHVDSVVIGEAESVWQNVTTDFLKGNLQEKYEGVLLDLENMRIPRRDLFSKQYAVTSVQTSRGCPMDCDFCSVTVFNGKRYRLRPVEEVLDELEGIPQKGIFFVDDNLIGYGKASRQRARDLFRGMSERRLDKKWICQASINFGVDEALLSLASKSGCVMVLLGLESDDPEELRYMNKKMNLRYDYRKILRNINRHGILVFGGFIFGVKNETEKSMWRKAGFICRKRVDVVQTTVLTPLPGTRLFKAALEEDRLLHTDFPKDWERYNMVDYTYALDGIGEEEFAGMVHKCMSRIFSKWTLAWKCLRTILYTKRVRSGISAYVINRTFGRMWRRIGAVVDARFDRGSSYPGSERPEEPRAVRPPAKVPTG